METPYTKIINNLHMAKPSSVLLDMSAAFHHPTSKMQIPFSSRELSFTSTATYPAAYLLTLLMSQKHIELNSRLLQTHPMQCPLL